MRCAIVSRATSGATALLVALVLAGCRGQEMPAPPPPAPPPPAAVSIVALPSGPANTPEPMRPKPTLPPTDAPSATPTRTVSPTPAPTSTPTPTRAPEPVRLTAGGCCTQPFWSPDSEQVRFIDKPEPGSPVGIWGVSVDAPGDGPILVTERVEESLAQGGYLVEAGNDMTIIERLSDGKRWTVSAARGRNVLISPDQQRLAWSITNDDLPPDQQSAAVWVANLDGSDARQVATLRRGGLSGWISEDALLVSGRENTAPVEQALSVLSLADGTLTELARAERLRSPMLSPSGAWVAFYTTFDENPARNGLWLARTEPAPGDRPQLLPRDFFGSYQWRGCLESCSPEQDRLIVVPFRPDAEHHQFLELDPVTLAARALTDPQVTPVKIANGDWRVSPDGRYVAFVESRDRNVWIIVLP